MSPATLVLTLAGPLQSWGVSKGTENRRTGLYPTKSGVLGIIAAALGRGVGESVSDLNHLEMVVRVDHAGDALTDFHTARTNDPAKKPQTAPKPSANTTLTYRSYRMDAVFTVFLTGDRELVETVHNALRNPVYPPFLGRRAAVPSMPVYPYNSRILDGFASDYIEHIPWNAPSHVRRAHRGNSVELVVVRDARKGDTPHGTIMDTPAGVREYLPRSVVRETVTIPAVRPRHTVSGVVPESARTNPFLPSRQTVLRPAPPAHDPFALLTPIKD